MKWTMQLVVYCLALVSIPLAMPANSLILKREHRFASSLDSQ
jgi:hypothetical protein